MKIKTTIFLLLMNIVVMNLYAADNSCDYNSYSTPPKKTPAINAYNAPAQIDVRMPWSIFVYSSFIYWHPNGVGLDMGYLFSNDMVQNTQEMAPFDSRYYPGFKVAIGGNTSYDNWDIFLEYTRFHFSHRNRQGLPSFSDGIVNQLFSQSLKMSQMTSKWRLDLDILDFLIGRPYYNGKSFTVIPNFGARGGWIHNKWDVSAESNGSTSDASLKSRTWILGPKAGASLNWILFKDFRVFTKSYISLLYQRFSNRIFIQSITNKTFATNRKSKTRQLTPNLQFSLGAGYNTYFDQDRRNFDITIGYDFEYFWDQNEYFNVEQVPAHFINAAAGDVLLHGLDISIKFSF